MSAYGAPSTPTAGGAQPLQGYPAQPGQPPVQPANPNAPRLDYGGPMEPEEKPLSEMEKALKKLVNVDRIDEPAEQEYTLTLKVKEEAKMTKDGHSRGKPPAAVGLVGSNATLDHIRSVKPVSHGLLVEQQYVWYDCLFITLSLFSAFALRKRIGGSEDW